LLTRTSTGPAAAASRRRSSSLLTSAVSAGLDIGFDVYPYDASASSIAQYFLPG